MNNNDDSTVICPVLNSPYDEEASKETKIKRRRIVPYIQQARIQAGALPARAPPPKKKKKGEREGRGGGKEPRKNAC